MRAILALAAVLLAMLASGAQAATVTVTRLGTGTAGGIPANTYSLNYAAAPGEINDPIIFGAMAGVPSWVIRDAKAGMKAGPGCVPGQGGLVCSVPPTDHGAYLAHANIDLGDGNDRGSTLGVDAFIKGGSGDDTLRAANYPVVFDGGSGADTMSGPAGSIVTYAGRANPVTVTLDGLPGDGEVGEGDNVTGATSHVIGGSAGDTLTAGARSAVLEGGAGNDLLIEPGPGALLGGPGNDVLHGGSGNNVLDGGTGADLMTGGPGEDTVSYRSRGAAVRVTLDGVANDGQAGEGDNASSDVEDVYGGLGNDVLVGSALRNVLDGGAGNNTLLGGSGPDDLYSQGGNDLVDGGPGSDHYISVGPGDTVRSKDGVIDTIDCYQAGSPVLLSDVNEYARSCAPRPIVPDGDVLKLSRSRRLTLPVTCPVGPLECAGTVTISFGDGPGTLGSGSYKVAPGATQKLRLKLSAKLLRPLRGLEAFAMAAFKTKRAAPRSTNVVNSALELKVPR